jgi:hypothetical protein
MLSIPPFAWRRLRPSAQMEHCLDESGALLLRVPGEPTTPPLAHLGRLLLELGPLGIQSLCAANGDGWMLHTRGAPRAMHHVAKRWLELAREASQAFAVDERVLLATIGAEVGDLAPDHDNEVKAPRTSAGYPSRMGPGDAGDAARDARDWTASHGAHTKHGLLQTTVKQATDVRADLFAKVTPDRYRAVLADPVASITCASELLAQMSPSLRRDPLAQRVEYMLGGPGVATRSPWGVALEDDVPLLRFIVAWNDDVRLRAGERIDASSPLGDATSLVTAPRRSAPLPVWSWLVAVAGALVAGGGATWWFLDKRQRAEEEEEEFVLLPANDTRLLAGARTFLSEEDDGRDDATAHGPFLVPAAPKVRSAAR